jgi:hypothetical protein
VAEEFGSREVGSAVLVCPDKAGTRPVHWIEIRLVGEDDSPVPNEAYRIELPDGSVATGYLDENGLARVENIEAPGNCKITFPELDRDAWEPLGAPTK